MKSHLPATCLREVRAINSAAVPSTSRETMRISSAVLPTEQPVIPAEISGFDESYIVFRFTVDADGATSILRHPTHPQHDGLRWAIKTPAPSGDDFNNYKSTVKPELFSVGNYLRFQLDLNGPSPYAQPEKRNLLNEGSSAGMRT